MRSRWLLPFVLAAGVAAADKPVATVTATHEALDDDGDYGAFVVSVSPAQALTVRTGQLGLVRTTDDGEYRHWIRCMADTPAEWFVRIEPDDAYVVGEPSWARMEAICPPKPPVDEEEDDGDPKPTPPGGGDTDTGGPLDEADFEDGSAYIYLKPSWRHTQ